MTLHEHFPNNLANIVFCFRTGWIDDHMKDDVWKNMNAHAFTTGRPRQNPSSFGKKIPPVVRPKSQTLKQPGKLNLIESNAQGIATELLLIEAV